MPDLLPADLAFFLRLFKLSASDQAAMEQYFDLRPASVKRAEFARVRGSVLKALLDNDRGTCMLAYPGICDPSSGWEVDHLIPLQSNHLNKILRGMKGTDGKKVPALSYGSNAICNLLLACARCNGHKKHRFLDLEHMQKILRRVN